MTPNPISIESAAISDPILREDFSDGRVVLTLNRPEKRNCFSLELLETLQEQLRSIHTDLAVSVVILRGLGSMFCSGLDLREAAQGTAITDEQGNATPRALVMVRLVLDVLKMIETMNQVVIVAAHGRACGGGAGLIAAADFAIVDTGFKLTFPEVRRGLSPALLHPFLQRRYSHQVLRSPILSGLPIEGEALMSFVYRVVPTGTVFDTAMNLALTLTQGEHAAIVQAKRLLNESLIPTEEEVTRAIEEHWRSWNSPAGREGIAAFLEKREPVFRAK